MKLENINSHLDKCTGEEPRAPLRNPTFAPSVSQRSKKPLGRLPHLSYSIYKEAALRKKLQELGISAAGTKPLLEKRHTEWVTLWNANCDASKPRKKAELLRDLDIWERTQGGGVPNGNGFSTVTEVRSKDFDAEGWSTKHDDSFKSLIENARRKIAPSKTSVATHSGGMAQAGVQLSKATKIGGHSLELAENADNLLNPAQVAMSDSREERSRISQPSSGDLKNDGNLDQDEELHERTQPIQQHIEKVPLISDATASYVQSLPAQSVQDAGGT